MLKPASRRTAPTGPGEHVHDMLEEDTMCGRFTLTNPGQLSLRFDVDGAGDAELEPRFNVAPSHAVPVIVDVPEGRVLQQMRWGFRPAWAGDDPKHPAPINARAETVAERPLFRAALAQHRCLIPAD